MKFKLIQENLIEEDLKSKYGFSFEDLMKAALDGNDDFVLNPIDSNEIINLSEEKWDKLYDILFKTDEDTTYYGDEYEKEVKKEDAFAKRYSCVKI